MDDQRIGRDPQPVKRSVTLEKRYGYTDYWGRLVFDVCQDDQTHLLAPTPPGEERRRCRFWGEDLLPQEARGRRGNWTIEVTFVPEGEG